MDNRTGYVETLSAQMVEWDNQIDRLRDKAKSAGPDGQPDFAEAIGTLQQKRDEAARKLQAISAASDDEWEGLKAGTDEVWGEVRGMLRAAILKIK